MSIHLNSIIGMVLMGALGGAVLGFLFFNFPPARIFLGDSGSLLLGFLIGALSLVGTSMKKGAAVALLIPIIALGLPILDTLLAIVRRWFHRMPIGAPDRQHIHHVLVSMGYSPRRAVLSLYAFSVILGVAALLMSFQQNEVVVLVVVALTIVAYASIRIFGGFRVTDLMLRFSSGQARRELSSHLRVEYMRVVHRLRDAGDADQAWTTCCPLFEVMDLDYAELRLFQANPEDPRLVLSWKRPMSSPHAVIEDPAVVDSNIPPPSPADIACRLDPAADHWMGNLGLRTKSRICGALTIEKHLGRSPLLADVPELLDRLRGELAAVLCRLEPPDTPTTKRPPPTA
jgi:UDP-GlcNAc:undecaprenyl-phosphate GlcNAc-1-phosphate transferase